MHYKDMVKADNNLMDSHHCKNVHIFLMFARVLINHFNDNHSLRGFPFIGFAFLLSYLVL